MQPIDANELQIDLGVLTQEPAEAYHARSGEHLSSHRLLDFMKCPWLYRKKQLGLIQESDSAAFLLGRAAHVRILEGRETYEKQFALGGPINPQTGKPYGPHTKAFAEWVEVEGRPVLTHAQVDLIEMMAGGVSLNDHAVELLLYGQAEGVVRADYCGLPCQIRLDWVHPHRGIVDLKTADDLSFFEFDARRFRYIHQMAFYRAVLAQALGGVSVPVHIIAIEKKQPHRAGTWIVCEDALAVAQQENEAAIQRLRYSHEHDEWPTGFETTRILNAA